MSSAELANVIKVALAKSVRDVTRYDDTKAMLAGLLDVKPEEVSIKVVGDVAADFKNRIGEVAGRRNTRAIAVLLTLEKRTLAQEIDRATEQTRQLAPRIGFSGLILLFGEGSTDGWRLERAVEVDNVGLGSEALVQKLNLPSSVVYRLETSDKPPEIGPAAWLEFTYSAHKHGGSGWELGTCLWSPVLDREGRERYGVMELPQPDDVVVHCVDSRIVGESVVRASVRTVTTEPPNPGDWAGRDKYYRIDLSGYREFDQAIEVESFIERFAYELRSELAKRPKYYPFMLYGDEDIRVPQGAYLTRLSPLLLQRIRDSVARKPTQVSRQPRVSPMPNQNDLFLERSEFQEILEVLKRQKNLILQGPPGVGKSYVARRLAYALLGMNDADRMGMVQFHQSYSYEDFIQGWRPKSDGGFYLRNGPFHDFCESARGRHEPFVFIIDEINRGNVSRIFGELMLLIESDKRTADFGVPLAYADPSSSSGHFWVPESVHLIGLMNTADRSLAMVDYALRRRFAFKDLRPAFGRPQFKGFLRSRGASESLTNLIIERMTSLNALISADVKNLGPGFEIGHSFFCPRTDDVVGDEWYERVVEYEIAPLIREYYFDDREKADDLIGSLRK